MFKKGIGTGLSSFSGGGTTTVLLIDLGRFLANMRGVLVVVDSLFGRMISNLMIDNGSGIIHS
jgi:hypothetical protein